MCLEAVPPVLVTAWPDVTGQSLQVTEQFSAGVAARNEWQAVVLVA